MGNKHQELSFGFKKRDINSGDISYVGENNQGLFQPCKNIARLNDLSSPGEYALQLSNSNIDGKKKRIIGWGLRKFSKIVCAKMQAKGRTTYKQIADEVVTEYKDVQTEFPFDEKNIRRRVYDAVNVLMAIDYIAKDKKTLRWIGCTVTEKSEDLEELKGLHRNLVDRVQAKAEYVKELENRIADLQHLMLHNKQAKMSGNLSSEGIGLPFLLVRTHSRATVEIEISEDMRLVHFDFNGTPFTLHDDASILKAKRVQHVTQSSSDGSSLVIDQKHQQMDPSPSPSRNPEGFNL